MTVREKATHEDKATVWSEFEQFRHQAKEAMSRIRLDTADSLMQINELFHTGIVEAYFERVPIPGPGDGRTQVELAEKFGVHKRWMDRKITPDSLTVVERSDDHPLECRTAFANFG